MRILVTGPTGFLGKHLARRLHTAGHDVILMVREWYGLGQPLPSSLQSIREHLTLVYADLRNLALVRRALAEAQPQAIIHLAAAGVTDPFLAVDSAIRHNLNGTINVLRAAFEGATPVQQLIVARTPGESNPANAYQASKSAAWRFCQMYARQNGWPIVGATVFQAYGPGQPTATLVPSAFRAALAGADFPMTSGLQERDWIYVEDVVEGLMATAVSDIKPGTNVELGTGIVTPVLEVVNRIYALANRGGQPLPGALGNRPGEISRQVADMETTRALLGWRPAVTLQQGLQKFLEWCLTPTDTEQ
jgi:nucleoside-diphosphate-sugar epimerase